MVGFPDLTHSSLFLASVLVFPLILFIVPGRRQNLSFAAIPRVSCAKVPSDELKVFFLANSLGKVMDPLKWAQNSPRVLCL